LRFSTAGSLLLALLLAACIQAPPAGGPLRVVDDAGREVALAGPATRIASLIPATTEWLFALGAGERLVGRSAWCDYPEAAAALPNLGNGIVPAVEAILAVRPDLVLLYDSPANATARERLAALGIPVLLLRTDALGDLDRHLGLLGVVTGDTAAAGALRARIRARLDEVSVPAAETAPRVLLVAWDQPPMTLGRGSFLSEILERAGGRNLFGDIAAPSATISLEAVVARDPDYVLVTSRDSVPAFAARPEWAGVAAVRDRRFVRVHGSEFNRPGPRTPEAILSLRRALAAAAR
jgi:ABC-type Fe3+-hydroxamate transport system substrate-binding protein